MYFPYTRPYSIQQQLMKHLYNAVTNNGVTVVESPTGTGKTLSLICSSIQSLKDARLIKRQQVEQQVRSECNKDQTNKDQELDWVIEHEIQTKLKELDQADRLVEQRLQQIRTNEQQLMNDKEKHRYLKRRRLRQEHEDKSLQANNIKYNLMDQYAPDEYFESTEDAHKVQQGGSDNFSPAVRAMMNRLYGTSTVKEEVEPDTPKILFASRTHSQLSQFVAELRKTAFSKTLSELTIQGSSNDVELDWRPVRLIPLGSRQNLCINDEIRNKSGGNNEALGDMCLELQKGKTNTTKGGENKGTRCPYLPPADEPTKLNEFRDKALATVRDIDDIENLGRKTRTCPYYGSRKAVRSAEIVTLPYNMLLSKATREALDITLQDNIVVIDEAHNLIDSILQLHSVSITSTMLTSTRSALLNYIAKFKSRLTGANASHLKQFALVLKGLSEFAQKWPVENQGLDKWGKKEEMINVNNLLHSKYAGAIDQINLLKLDEYLRQSRIARKIGGYTDAIAEEQTAAGRQAVRANATRNLQRIQEFVLSLANAEVDGRILLSAETIKAPVSTTGANTTKTENTATLRDRIEVTFKYMLLSPGESFRDVAEQAKSVVLAGGTMAPMSDFREQLFPTVPLDRFSTFSCGHVVAPDHVATFAVNKGPTGIPLLFTFDRRKDDKLLDELGQTIVNIVQLVPKGVVVFVPSYDFLNSINARWVKSGVIKRLAAKKQVFWEPKTTSEVEPTLRDYAQANLGDKNGSILFAVVGAKLSEGINFADDMARGIPYPNSNSVELKERMTYLRSVAKSDPSNGGSDPGQVLYNNLAFRAVNQSIGRAIRNVNDWAAIILLDERYQQYSKRSQLPQWLVGHQTSTNSNPIPQSNQVSSGKVNGTNGQGTSLTRQDRVQVVEHFGTLVKGLNLFVKARKAATNST
ncbi:ATP-dependent DNA helicase chl1 [Microbotryomycetes sp. JL221]|nr:ATP-dependent DNA helicase chl1 [Microbotryomycetes sp. JL221]